MGARIPAMMLLAPLLMGAAAPRIPDSPAGRFLSAFLTTYNSGDTARIKQYNDLYHGTLPPAVWIAQHDNSGDLVPVKIEAKGPNSLTALMSASDADDFYRQAVEIDPANAQHVMHITFGTIERPAGYAIPRLSSAAAANALEARAAGLVAADRFAGTMMIERGGKIIFAKAWGLADRENKRPVTLDTKFRIGSDNKMFTAVAILQLVEAGKIALDGTVGHYLPDYPNKEFADTVTIRQLLTHTGGAGDIFGPDFDKNRLSLKHNDDYVRLYGKRAPDMSANGKDAYANYGFVLLGYIIEHVSGEDYYDYVRKHIFLPAGMTDTGSLPEDVAVAHRSKGYTRTDGKLTDNADTLPYRGMAAGGGYSTARDLIRFADALRSGRLISKALLAEATTPQNPGKWYGFGFEVHGQGPARYWGHGGGAPGMNAAFRVYPQSDVVIVALSNLDPPGADKLATFYANRMPVK